MKNLLKDIWNYLTNFGFIFISFAVIFIFLFKFLPNVAPYLLLGLVSLLFIFKTLSLVYSLVSGFNKLGFFLILFIFTQLVFSFFYYSQFRGYIIIEECERKEIVKSNAITDSLNKNLSIKSEILNTETKIEVKPNKEQETNKLIKITSIGFKIILFNTFYTSLIQESGPLFNYVIEDETHELYGGVYLTMIIQIFISWIYLGVLIAGLYQKLRNE